MRNKLFFAVPLIIILMVIAINLHSPAGPSVSEGASLPAPPSDADIVDDNGLGGGAYATWAFDGYEIVSPNGVSSVSTIFIQGRKEDYLTVHIEVAARFDCLEEELYNETLEIRPGEERIIPINILAGAVLDAKQTSYLTVIQASAVEVRPDGRPGWNQLLEPRFIAVRENGRHEVFDLEHRNTFYADGITTEAERQRYWEMVGQWEIDDSISLGVSPGACPGEPLQAGSDDPEE